MDKQYYTEYFTLEREHWWFVVRGKILMQRLQRELPSNRPLQILNIGVATGRTSELLSQFGQVTSLEYDEDCRNFTAARLDMEIILGSILELPFDDDSFDLVCAFDVIEHVEDDRLGVNEMRRVCRPGGHLCITVPAFMSMWGHHDVVNHHYRRYRMRQVVDLLESSPGKMCYQSYFNSLLFVPIWIYRQLSRLLPRKHSVENAGADCSVTSLHSLPNIIAGKIFDFERWLLKLGIRFPAGVSILLLWQHTGQPDLSNDRQNTPTKSGQ